MFKNVYIILEHANWTHKLVQFIPIKWAIQWGLGSVPYGGQVQCDMKHTAAVGTQLFKQEGRLIPFP